jgi:hypothetical protein
MLRVRLRYLTLKLRALCWVLRRLARPRGAVSSPRKTSRAVIARTIIEGTTSMRESPDCIVVFYFKMATSSTGKATSRSYAELVVLLLHAPAASKRFAAQEIFGSAFCQNFDNVPSWHIMDSWCGIGATRRRAWQCGWLARLEG